MRIVIEFYGNQTAKCQLFLVGCWQFPLNYATSKVNIQQINIWEFLKYINTMSLVIHVCVLYLCVCIQYIYFS